ncbi:MAG: ABC-F family ATP-binding cassette domain-containing protein [Solirubrobacterales bacterium]
MAVAIASQIGIHVGGQPLFDDVSFRLTNRERMTLSGRNGAGKSTLLRILAAELLPDSGKLSLRRGARVALHDQRPPRERAISLGDYVLSARAEMIALEAELERLEQVMSAGDHDEVTLGSYSNAQQKLETAGGYRWRDDVFAVLRGLGFEAEPEMTERPLSTFSGGELTRASLARALAAGPDLLLLDEPTNHLDIPSLEWLEDHLQGLEAAIVLVAHDRWFLEAVGTSVLELEAGRARFFSGPWHAWRKEKAAREIALGKAIERQTAEIERMERFVERFRYKATKARQAQARIKQIEKLKANAVSHDPRDQRALRFSFATPERAGRFPLKVESARIEVGARVLLEQVTLRLERGEHAVLVGPNGAGKTTLIDTLAGRREPTAGVVKLGHNASLGYLSQHADTAAGTGTVLEAAQRGTGLTGQKVRDLLGHFMFSGDEVEKQLTDISGGEQRRLSLAILVASGANVLILDEPTNHLDLESREALEDALTGFEGALLLVSHDRALLEAVGSRTFAIEDGDLHSYQMGWAEYQRTVQERESTEKETARAADRTSASSSANGKRSTAPRGPSKNALKKIASLERQIEQAEQALATLEEELSDPAAWASPGNSDRSTERHRELKQRIEELYDSWGAAGGSADAN